MSVHECVGCIYRQVEPLQCYSSAIHERVRVGLLILVHIHIIRQFLSISHDIEAFACHLLQKKYCDDNLLFLS